MAEQTDTDLIDRLRESKATLTDRLYAQARDEGRALAQQVTHYEDYLRIRGYAEGVLEVLNELKDKL